MRKITTSLTAFFLLMGYYIINHEKEVAYKKSVGIDHPGASVSKQNLFPIVKKEKLSAWLKIRRLLLSQNCKEAVFALLGSVIIYYLSVKLFGV
jgi:hypothetical protein